ncbi:MAG TPA: DNA polymerase III subunit delta' [Verrucomicrobiae bacterium]|nr:DNA polymerase III subunit delta' [Verrucomicrobiae bacterium]
MQGFDVVKGQPRAVATLVSALSTGKVAHAYLFTGPKGIGKGLTAQVFARALNCESNQVRPCDTCLSCTKALHGNHPDIHSIRPDGLRFKIEQVRMLQKQVYTRTLEGRYKVFIVEEMHKATLQASNSLLKVLEEPPGNTVFILVTENIQAIPATIVSRCQRIPFAVLDKETIAQLLVDAGYAPDRARDIAAQANGSMAEAKRSIENEQLLVAKKIALEFLEGAFSQNYYRAFKAVDSLEKEKVEVGDFLEQGIFVLRNTYLDRLQSETGVDGSNVPGLGSEEAKQALKLYLQASEYHRRQANSKILLDVLSCRLANLAGAGRE